MMELQCINIKHQFDHQSKPSSNHETRLWDFLNSVRSKCNQVSNNWYL